MAQGSILFQPQCPKYIQSINALLQDCSNSTTILEFLQSRAKPLLCSTGFPVSTSHRGHSLDGLQRIAALGGLSRQHDTIGTVQDGVGNVTALGTSGTRLLHHALQHLGDERKKRVSGGKTRRILILRNWQDPIKMRRDMDDFISMA